MNKIFTITLAILVIAGLVLFFYPQDQTLEPTQQETMTQKPSLDTTTSQQINSVVFEVKGINFAFDVTEIRVQEGDTVTINFESSVGFHDLTIDEFNAKTAQVNPGTPTSVTFVADKAGEYEYYCSVGQHRSMGMVGKLIVEAKQ